MNTTGNKGFTSLIKKLTAFLVAKHVNATLRGRRNQLTPEETKKEKEKKTHQKQKMGDVGKLQSLKRNIKL